jgi:WD40 repeat protein
VDGVAQVWQVDGGVLLLTLTGHTSLVNTVVFSADGSLLVTGSTDGTIRLWGVP